MSASESRESRRESRESNVLFWHESQIGRLRPGDALALICFDAQHVVHFFCTPASYIFSLQEKVYDVL